MGGAASGGWRVPVDPYLPSYTYIADGCLGVGVTNKQFNIACKQFIGSLLINHCVKW